MTRKDWFIVQNSIVDRDDLSIYEKMCCVVLARYADKEEFYDLLTSDIIAIKMGVEQLVAKKTVFGLIEKGLINFDGKTKSELDYEIYNEEIKINKVLEEAKSERIIKGGESSNKLSMSEFKKRLNAINAIKDSNVKDVFDEPSKNIVRSEEVKGDKSGKSEFANLKFEDIFDDRQDESSVSKDHGEPSISNEQDKSVISNEELDYEFEKTLINDEWASELEKVEDIIQKSNKDEDSVYSTLSEEAKYHLGMLEDQREPIKSGSSSLVKSDGGYKKETTPNSKDHYHSLVDKVYEILDGQINEREARIILSFANNDIERIREKYKIAKRSQINDKIEVLINELQKKETSSVQAAGVSQISEDDMEKLPNTQINMANINKMKMYSKYSKK
ncbi:MAG: hypothetical protein WBA54_14415 [Acidaminobacteraceae bacterium]